MDRRTSQEPYSKLRTSAAALVTAFVLAACTNNNEATALDNTPATPLSADSPGDSDETPAPSETRYIPADPAITRVAEEQTTSTTRQPDATESASPESKNASEYIRSSERREIIDAYLTDLDERFTKLLEQNPDKVWFHNFTTGEITEGAESATGTGQLEIIFDVPGKEKIIFANVNQSFGDKSSFIDRRAGYGVVTGTNDDPKERVQLSRIMGPTGDMFDGALDASYVLRAENSNEQDIRGGTSDLDNTSSDAHDVQGLDLQTRLVIAAAMDAELVPNPNTVMTGQIEPAQTTTTLG